MSFANHLKQILETEERRSVGNAFGGNWPSASFSLPKIRDNIASETPFSGNSQAEISLATLKRNLANKTFKTALESALRFSFLIELTNLTVGSTKMKTRWLPGLIQMPQANSFEPIHGEFRPDGDPRSATYDECLAIFTRCLELVVWRMENDKSFSSFVNSLNQNRQVAYEFPLGYIDRYSDRIHRADNIAWIENEDIRWLVTARALFKEFTGQTATAIKSIQKNKIQIKVYKTDRALTGKDKTNRAKRWEVLPGDFQYAPLDQCWSVERALLKSLLLFESFPKHVRERFLNSGLIVRSDDITRCPVTLAPLNYNAFSASVVNSKHGQSDYQVGHLTPLKKGGSHVGDNVCWQSADGNRIQGDLTVAETDSLLDAIYKRRLEVYGAPLNEYS